MNPQSVDITKLSVVELKALGYDVLGQIEVGQRNLQAINQEIAKRSETTPEEPKLETEKKDK